LIGAALRLDTHDDAHVPQVPGEHLRLDWHLDNWTIYTYTGSSRLLRCKTQSHWSSGSNDFDKMVAYEVDLKSALALDALIWTPNRWRDEFGRIHVNPLGLTPAELASVLHEHINAVWRFNRLDIRRVYGGARMKLSSGLRKKGIP